MSTRPAARAKDPGSGRSVLHGRRTTCLPEVLGRYYRTCPQYVEDEVREALARPHDFERGPVELFRRGTRDDDGPAFVVEDGACLFAKKLLERW